MKKNDKKNTIEISESSKKMTRIKWKNFKVHHLIAIHREMDEEYVKQQQTKSANKQGKLFLDFSTFFRIF